MVVRMLMNSKADIIDNVDSKKKKSTNSMLFEWILEDFQKWHGVVLSGC